MKHVTGIVLSAVVVVVAVLAVKVFGVKGAAAPPRFSTPYQAVLLDNGQVYYGKLSRLGVEYAQMTDVYYIVRTQDAQTKQVKNVLVHRGKELHAPTATFFEASHIIMIEPVGTGSEVAKLIAQAEAQPPR